MALMLPTEQKLQRPVPEVLRCQPLQSPAHFPERQLLLPGAHTPLLHQMTGQLSASTVPTL